MAFILRGLLCLCVVIFMAVICNQCPATQLSVPDTIQHVIIANLLF